MVVKAGGRVPCQVSDKGHVWHPDVLFKVRSAEEQRDNGSEKFACDINGYRYCRIKKSDLKVSE